MHLDRYGSLSFFVLENVVGASTRKRSAGHEDSFIAWFQAQLEKSLSRPWDIELKVLNAIDSSLPHFRPRIFLVGMVGKRRVIRFLAVS